MTVQREVKERKLNEFITGSSCSSSRPPLFNLLRVLYIISRSGYKEVRPSFSLRFSFSWYFTIFNTKLRTTKKKKKKIEIKIFFAILKCSLRFLLLFRFGRPDFGAGKARSAAQSGQCWRWIRVQSIGAAERRRRSETGPRGAAEQRQNGRATKVVHHYPVDGAEPATHCPTQRGS